MNFIGRTEERKIINDLLSSDGYKGCVIYGRRRLGKTELIKNCLLNSDIKYLIYQCKQTDDYDNALSLTQEIKDKFNIDYINFTSTIEAIKFIFDYSKDNNIAFIIDEYPYLRSLIKGCDSKLQEIIDSKHNSSNLKLFLVGSSITTMEDILQSSSPLYQRFNQSILLKQMDYYDASKFYPQYSDEEKIEIYSVFGGVPFYLRQIDTKLSVKENIIKLISGKFALFDDFIDNYLKAELRK